MEANTTSHQIHIWSDFQGVTALYTERCFHSRYTTSNQSWTLEWPGNAVNEVMQQLNQSAPYAQSAPDTQSLHIVAMEIACQ